MLIEQFIYVLVQIIGKAKQTLIILACSMDFTYDMMMITRSNRCTRESDRLTTGN